MIIKLRTHRRQKYEGCCGQGSCGIATGAKKTLMSFSALRQKNLNNVVIDKTGCIGTCYLEPIVDVYNDEGALEARYVKCTTDKVERIVEEHLMGGKTVEEFMIPAEDEGFLFPSSRESFFVTADRSIREDLKNISQQAVMKLQEKRSHP